jgi:hypothetical protein
VKLNLLFPQTLSRSERKVRVDMLAMRARRVREPGLKERQNQYLRTRRASDPEYAERKRRLCRESHQRHKAKYYERVRKWRQANPEKPRLEKLQRIWGISGSDYLARFNSQRGLCAICKRPESEIDSRSGRPRWLAVDHEHKSGIVRGLLCGRCNKAVGLLNDDPLRLRAAADYLEKRT